MCLVCSASQHFPSALLCSALSLSEELKRVDPALHDEALRAPPPPPAWLRCPTLTPPVQGYSPGMGFPIPSEEETEQGILDELGIGGGEKGAARAAPKSSEGPKVPGAGKSSGLDKKEAKRLKNLAANKPMK